MNALINYTPLQSLRFAKFSLLLEASETLHLPEYKGSAVRGGFGNAFKKAVCMTKTFDCPPCLLQKACPYFSIFESKVEKSVADLLRIGKDAPHPFLLEPPLTEQREFTKGQQLTVHLVLIGKAMDMLPHFIYAFTVFGERVGLGRAKGKFMVRQVSDAEGTKVYDAHTQSLKNSYRIFTYEDFADAAGAPRREVLRERIKLTFITPTRIMTSYGSGSRHLVRLRESKDFGTLVETLYHRMFALANLYCAPEVLDYTRHKPRVNAARISLTEASIRWQDWERYSNRQQTRMKLGGFVGEATFEGELREFIPLLRMGEHLHVGKNTSFGLGKYVLNE
jgi:CRISPR/Cas system endoribonuclease Cas6 (RAMP superfamily)